MVAARQINLAVDKQTPQPFNIPPLQTALFHLIGTLSFPYQDELEVGSKTAANYLNGFVAKPLEMKLVGPRRDSRVAMVRWRDVRIEKREEDEQNPE